MGGQLAFFSSFGPTLDGRLKPSLSGPGVNVESSLSSFRDGSYNVTETVDFEGTTYEFARLSGTSMSSPAVAGIVALMLEANPALSSDQVRTILEETAREDNNTGTLPEEGDPVWGHGKVTATAAIQAALALNAVEQSDPRAARFTAYPNPAQGETTLSGITPGTSWQAELRGFDGRLVRRFAGTGNQSLDLTNISEGLYVITVVDDKATSQSMRVIVQ